LKSVDFVQVFQSDLSNDAVFAFKCSHPFVHMCGLNGSFQYVIMIIKMIQHYNWWISFPVHTFGAQVWKNVSMSLEWKV